MTLAQMPRTGVTSEELLGMPDNNGMELVGGQIVEKNVSVESSQVEGLVYWHLQNFCFSHQIATVYPATLGYRCFNDDPDKIRKPDATVVKIERVRALPSPNPGYMPIVPDLAVEVISPNDLAYEVTEKVAEYLEAGFPLVWVADPSDRTVTVYPKGGKPVIYTADDELTAESALPGFRCKVGDFFPAVVL